MEQIKLEEGKNYRRTTLAVLRNHQGKILIALNPRINSTDPKFVDKDTYKIPQGGVEIGENPNIALYREMDEELGLNLKEFENPKQLDNYVSYWFRNSDKDDYEIRLYGFLINVGNFDKESLIVDPEEIKELHWIDPKELQNLNLGIRHQAYLSILRRFNLF